MLILIVVSAAIALAAFVASYEAQVLSEDNHNHMVGLESIRVVSVQAPLRATGAFWFLNFTIASSDVNPTIVTSISLNGEPLRNYTAVDLDTAGSSYIPIGDNLNLTPDEEATVQLNLTSGTLPYSFLSPSYVPTPSSYLRFDIDTYLGNDFERAFLPPTAVAYVSTITSISGGAPVQVALFVGADSFQPGENESIVSWSWTVYQGTTLADGPLLGEDVEPSGLTTGTAYTVDLTVTGSDGLEGFTSIPYVGS